MQILRIWVIFVSKIKIQFAKFGTRDLNQKKINDLKREENVDIFRKAYFFFDFSKAVTTNFTIFWFSKNDLFIKER